MFCPITTLHLACESRSTLTTTTRMPCMQESSLIMTMSWMKSLCLSSRNFYVLTRAILSRYRSELYTSEVSELYRPRGRDGPYRPKFLRHREHPRGIQDFEYIPRMLSPHATSSSSPAWDTSKTPAYTGPVSSIPAWDPSSRMPGYAPLPTTSKYSPTSSL